uniref:Uncharacterized protein n=1 Tax=Acrobeloides nanus TaxID=290746 RepID=A0A914CKM7_9BILA
MYMVLMTLLPFLFLLILNAFIVVKQSFTPPRSTENSCPENLASYMEMERSLVILPNEATLSGIQFTNRCKSACESQDGSKDDTITMIMVVVLFLCCNTLALLVNIIETFFDPDPLLLNLLSDATYEVRTHSPIWKPLTSGWKHRHDSNPLEPCRDGYWNREFCEQVSSGTPLCESQMANSRRSPSFSCSEMVLDDIDERDSGWDDGESSNVFTPISRRPGPFATSWLAEVKIMENSLSSGRPHIYVKPITKYGSTNMSNMSITAL